MQCQDFIHFEALKSWGKRKSSTPDSTAAKKKNQDENKKATVSNLKKLKKSLNTILNTILV